MLIGTERGMSKFDLESHLWANNLLAPSKSPGSPLNVQQPGIIDLAASSNRVFALRSDHQLLAWNPKNGAVAPLLGGGQLPQSLAQVKAVTRDIQGRLWLADQARVYIYDPAERRCQTLTEGIAGVEALAADSQGVWILAQGKLSFVAEPTESPQAAEDLPDRVREIFASLGTPGVTTRHLDGTVAYYSTPANVRHVVGAAAQGFSPIGAPAVGVRKTEVVFGGARPHVYSPSTRSWQPVDQVTNVAEIQSTAGELWLRSNGKILRMLDGAQTADAGPDASIIQLADRKGELMAADNQAGLWARAASGLNWQQIKSPANGPMTDSLTTPLIAIDKDDLYLAGGSKKQLWHFSWQTQRWQPLAFEDQPITAVASVTTAAGKAFALSKGQVYSFLPADGSVKREQVENVQQLAAIGDQVVATDRGGIVWIQEQQGWVSPLVPAESTMPVGSAIRDAVNTSYGPMLYGDDGAVLLDSHLAGWTAVSADQPLQIGNVQVSGDGNTVWVLDKEGNAFALAKSNDKFRWNSIQFPADSSPVRSLTLGNGANAAHWVCLNDGSLWQVKNDVPTAIKLPSAAPADPTRIVSIAEAPAGFLVAFRSGELATVRPGWQSWEAVETPANVNSIQEFISLRAADATITYWLLAGDGQLFRAGANNEGKWEQVATEISDMDASGRNVWATSAARGEVLQFSATGDPTTLAGPAKLPAGQIEGIAAVGEIMDADKNAILVLADKNAVYAYHPILRTWSMLEVQVAELHPVLDALMGRTSSGNLLRFTWGNGALVSENVQTPTNVRRLATDRQSRHFVASLDDGQLLLVQPNQAPVRLLGPVIDSTRREGTIRDMAAYGQTAAVALSTGEVLAQRSPQDGWESVGQFAGIRKLALTGGSLWIETVENAERTLRLLKSTGANWRETDSVTKLITWHRVGDAVVVVHKNDAEQTIAEHRTGNATTSLTLPESSGPDAAEVTGYLSSQHGLWFQTSAGAIWNFDPRKSTWQSSPLPTQKPVTWTAMDATSPVLLSDGQLLLGVRQDRGEKAWDFRPLKAKVVDVDGLDDHLAYATDDQLVVRDLRQTGVGAERQLNFNSAWPQDAQTPTQAVAQDATVWVLGENNSLASYNLQQRRWSPLLPAPAAVQQMFVAKDLLHLDLEGDHLARLAAGRWEDPSAKASRKWTFEQTEYEITAAHEFHQVVEQPDPPQSANRLAAGSPVRLHEAKSLWIEWSDGSLVQYDEKLRQYSTLVQPPAKRTSQTGLISDNADSYFISEPANQVYHLLDDKPVLIQLPEEFQIRSVSQGSAGLVLATADRWVVVAKGEAKEITDANEAKRIRDEAKAAKTDRHLQTDSWRIHRPAPQSSVQLQRSMRGDWVEMPILDGRFAWDVVRSGMHWKDRLVLFTAAGVSILPTSGAGPPLDLLPLKTSDEATDKGSWAWAFDTYAVVRDAQRDLWLLSSSQEGWKLEKPSTPESLWRVNRTADALQFEIEYFEQKRLPVTLSKAGRWGFDQPLSVALSDDIVWMATADGLFKQTLDLTRPVWESNARQVFANSRRDELFSQGPQQQTSRRVDAAWQPLNDSALLKTAKNERALSNRPGNEPIRVSLRIAGRDRELEYQGASLAISVPLTANGQPLLTTDGKNLYVATQAGLAVYDARGDLAALHATGQPIQGMQWDTSSADAPQLHLLLASSSGDSVVALSKDQLSPSDKDWAEFTKLTFPYHQQTCTLQISPNRTDAEVRTVGNENVSSWKFDLRKGGFVHELIQDAALTRSSIWTVSPLALERRKIETPQVGQQVTALDSDKDKLFKSVRQRLFLCDSPIAQGEVWELDEQGQSTAVAADDSIRNILSAGFEGDQWFVSSLERPLVYHFAQGEWRDIKFDTGRGFGVDFARTLLVHPQAVLLNTEAGLWSVPRTNQTTLELKRLAPQTSPDASEPLLVKEFWQAVDGTPWVQDNSGNWQTFDAEKQVLSQPITMSEEVADQRLTLFHSAQATWKRDENTVRLIETTPLGTVTSTLDSQGRFDSDSVFAATQVEDSLWCATAAGLRKFRLPDQTLLGEALTDQRDQRNRFDFLNNNWYLLANSEAFRLDGQQWKPIAAADLPNPAVAPIPVGTRFRIDRAQKLPRFEARDTSTSDRWHAIAFNTQLRRLGIHQANEAIIEEGYLHVATDTGVASWKQVGETLTFWGIQPELRKLKVVQAEPKALFVDEQGATHRFTNERWQAAPLTDEDRLVLAQSEGWRCEQSQAGGDLKRMLAGNWKPLGLSSKGDFDYQWINAVACEPDGTVWSIGDRHLVQWSAESDGRLSPEAILTPDEIGAKSDSAFTALTVHGSSIEVRLVSDGNAQMYSRDNRGPWQPLDDAEFASREQVLWKDPVWLIERAEADRLRIVQHFPDGTAIDLNWLGGRFDLDTVHAAALWENRLLLATPQALVVANPKAGDTQQVVEIDGVQQTTFAQDALRIVMTRGELEDRISRPLEWSQPAVALGTPLSPEESEDIVATAFRDSMWKFVLGSRPDLQWRGIPSGLQQGRFLHDSFRAAIHHTLETGESLLWLATPNSLQQFDVSAGGPVLASAYTLPDQLQGAEMVEAGNSHVAFRGKDESWNIDLAGKKWSQAIDGPAARSLVDTPLWSWDRNGDGQVSARFKLSTQPELAPVLDTQGRFAFDGAAAVLADGPQVWIAGHEGVIVRRCTDGEILYWHRTGLANSTETPLGQIVRMQRFDDTGAPVASWDVANQTDVRLFALGEDGRTWQFDGESPGTWSLSSERPFEAASGGRPIARTDMLDISEQPDGELRFSYRTEHVGASDAPVLQNGRFLADTMRKIVSYQGQPVALTAAGVVELNPTAGFQSLWTDGHDAPLTLANSTDLFIQAEEPQRLMVASADGPAYEFDPENQWWQPQESTIDLQHTAQVLFSNEFWTWSKWQDRINVDLRSTPRTATPWPLFVDGRFSFDVLQNYRLDGTRLWAATAGGVVQFDREDMKILTIDREAIDLESGESVTLRDVDSFAQRENLTIVDQRYHYVRRGDTWERRFGSLAVADTLVEYTDGEYF